MHEAAQASPSPLPEVEPEALPTEAQLHEVFEAFDADGDGAIDARELGAALQAMGNSLPDSVVASILERLDVDSSHSLDFDEFAHASLTGAAAAPVAEKLEGANTTDG